MSTVAKTSGPEFFARGIYFIILPSPSPMSTVRPLAIESF
jgi:hypothetical protein